MTNACPECKCSTVTSVDVMGPGFRICADCGQEWWTDIDYNNDSDAPPADGLTDAHRLVDDESDKAAD